MKKLLCALLIVTLLAVPLVGCAKPVSLSVWDPKDGATVTESPTKVRGWVSDNKATVWVNDTIVPVSKAKSFSTMIDLIEGENTIKIVAAQGKAGKWKNVISKTVTVAYSPQ